MQLEGVSSILVTSNDLAAAWALDDRFRQQVFIVIERGKIIAELIVEERSDDALRQGRADIADFLAHLVPELGDVFGTQRIARREDQAAIDVELDLPVCAVADPDRARAARSPP